MNDVWHYPLDRWAVWDPGERIGEHGKAARGFRKLAEAKAWASERYGVDKWRREDNGSYVPAAQEKRNYHPDKKTLELQGDQE